MLVTVLFPFRVGINGWTRGVVLAAWRQDKVRWLDSAGWKGGGIILGKHPPDRGNGIAPDNRSQN